MRIYTSDRQPIREITFHPEGHLFAAIEADGALGIWDMVSAEVRWRIPVQIQAVAFHPNGEELVAFHSQTYELNRWKLSDGTRIKFCKWNVFADRVKLEYFGIPTTSIRVAGANNLRIIYSDWADGKVNELNRQYLKVSNASQVAFSLDGSYLATNDAKQAVVFRIPFEEGLLPQHDFAMHSRVTALCFSPQSDRLAVAAGRSVKIWSMKSNSEPLTLSGHVRTIRSIAFSPNGKRIYTASHDHRIKVWDAYTGEEKYDLWWRLGKMSQVVVSPTGFVVAAVSQEGQIVMWDVEES
jgi:WD40 repeat protein